MKNRLPKGFTLIELVVVIAVLAILFAITLVAINPARQFAQARDTQRQNDVNAILNAMHQYLAVPGSTMPASIPVQGPGITPAPIGSAVGSADICALLVTAYIAEMPVDPSTGSYTDCTNYSTGYTIIRSASDNRLTIAATPEEATTISVTR